MKFDLTSPCKTCPFRTDTLKGWLGEGRAENIADSLFGRINGPFPCHNTVDYDSMIEETDDRNRESEQHCAGALILMEKLDHQSDIVQIADRISRMFPEQAVYLPESLKMNSPVFDTVEEFVRHQANLK